MGNSIEELWSHPNRVLCDPDTGRVWHLSIDNVSRKFDYGEHCVEYRVSCRRDGKTYSWHFLEVLEDEDRDFPRSPGSESFYLGEETRGNLSYVFGGIDNVPPYELIYDLLMFEVGCCTVPARWKPGYLNEQA